MGFMDKLKNMFTEEVEEDDVAPVKREMKVEITSPRVERVESQLEDEPKKDVSENEPSKREEKFVFPVYFDDKDFDDLEKPSQPVVPKEPVKKAVVSPKREIKKDNAYSGGRGQVQPEERKKFRPSPIISPVYGVLDKNYSKDDIMTKDRSRNLYHSKKEVTVDDVRQKAFGSLEDDLENTLFGKASFLFNDEVSDNDSSNESVNVEENKNEALINEKSESFDVLDQVKKEFDDIDHMFQQDTCDDDASVDMDLDNMINDELNKLIVDEKLSDSHQTRIKRYENEHNIDDHDSLTDSDLFHLIDTMYEKGDDK